MTGNDATIMFMHIMKGGLDNYVNHFTMATYLLIFIKDSERHPSLSD